MLLFSDAAKFADIARSILENNQFCSNFTFFNINLPYFLEGCLNYFGQIPPLFPLLVSVFFRIFGVNDLSVIFTSSFSLLLSAITLFFISVIVFKSKLLGIFVVFSVILTTNVLNLAFQGASETLLIFETALGILLITRNKKWSILFAVMILIMMYFTRPQAFIFIAGLTLYYLLLNFEKRIAIKYFVLVTCLALILDRLVLLPLSGNFFLYSITGRGLTSIVYQNLNGVSVSDSLRSPYIDDSIFTLINFVKNTLYNLYNFFKLIPQIMSPYMWTLFVISLFRWEKNKTVNALKVATIFMVVVTFLVAAMTIPFFRYLYPVVPLIYLFATETLVWIVGKVVDEWNLAKINRTRVIAVISSVLIFLFVVGQTLGVVFLDSRYKAKTVNKEKPSVYAQLSFILKYNTDPPEIIVTNLDTWGSWYGERKTVWYPLDPDMLKPPDKEEPPFDAIYLTSYLIDDENYYMGEEWRQIFENPENIENEYIDKYYKLKGIYEVPASDNYERMDARAVLLVRK